MVDCFTVAFISPDEESAAVRDFMADPLLSILNRQVVVRVSAVSLNLVVVAGTCPVLSRGSKDIAELLFKSFFKIFNQISVQDLSHCTHLTLGNNRQGYVAVIVFDKQSYVVESVANSLRVSDLAVFRKTSVDYETAGFNDLFLDDVFTDGICGYI